MFFGGDARRAAQAAPPRDPAQRLLLAGARGALADGRGDGPAGKAEVTPISRVLGLDRVFRVL